MSTDSWLELHRPENISRSDRRDVTLDLPEFIPKRLHGCGKVFNAAMIVGTALGLDREVAALSAILDGLDGLPDDIPHLFLHEDIQEALGAIETIHVELDKSLDREGRPKGVQGARLLQDPSFRIDADGFIHTVTGHIYLGDLLRRVEKLCLFFRHALKNRLLIEKENL